MLTLWFAIGDFIYLLQIVLHRLRCDALRFLNCISAHINELATMMK